MVKSCAVFGCKNRYAKGIRFHKFPKDPVLRKTWVKAIGRESYWPGLHAVVCGKHFKSTDYEINGPDARLLKDAVPSLLGNSSSSNEDNTNNDSPMPMETKSVLTENSNNVGNTGDIVGPSTDNSKNSYLVIYDNGVNEDVSQDFSNNSSPATEKNVNMDINSIPMRNTQIKSVGPFAYTSNTGSLKRIHPGFDNKDVKLDLSNLSRPEKNLTIVVDNTLEVVVTPISACIMTRQSDDDGKVEQSQTPDQHQSTPNEASVVDSSASKSDKVQKGRRYPVFFGDFHEKDLEVPLLRHKFWEVANSTVNKHRLKGMQNQRKYNRMKRKVDNLEALIKEYKKYSF